MESFAMDFRVGGEEKSLVRFKAGTPAAGMERKGKEAEMGLRCGSGDGMCCWIG